MQLMVNRPLGLPPKGFACELPGSVEQSVKLKIDLDSEIAIAHAPGATDIANSVGKVAFRFEVDETGKKAKGNGKAEPSSFTYSARIGLGQKSVPGASYGALRTLLARLAKDGARTLILRRKAR